VGIFVLRHCSVCSRETKHKATLDNISDQRAAIAALFVFVTRGKAGTELVHSKPDTTIAGTPGAKYQRLALQGPRFAALRCPECPCYIDSETKGL